MKLRAGASLGQLSVIPIPDKYPFRLRCFFCKVILGPSMMVSNTSWFTFHLNYTSKNQFKKFDSDV